MTDYKTMYHKMFNAVTDAERQLEQAMAALKSAQLECEEMFMEAVETPSSSPWQEK